MIRISRSIHLSTPPQPPPTRCNNRNYFSLMVFVKLMTFLYLIRTQLAFQINTNYYKSTTLGRRRLDQQRKLVSSFILQQHDHRHQRPKQQQQLVPLSFHYLQPTTICLFSSSSSSETDSSNPPPMSNLYQEWTLQEDQLLWTNRDKPSIELASLLGRGMRGVEARLSKLQDLSSPAYEKLFASSSSSSSNNDQVTTATKTKLVPAGEVLRRVQWDYMLDASDFLILHYDRVEDRILETPMDAPNDSIGGTSETMLVKALPEHRIEGIKYKERVVWDRQDRVDLVFGDPGIYDIIDTYEDWKKERDQVLEWNRQRQAMVAQRIKDILGLDLYGQLQELSSNLQKKVAGAQEDGDNNSAKGSLTNAQIETYVSHAMALFRSVRKDPTQSLLDLSEIPSREYDALDELSELVAVLPDAELRSLLLCEISQRMDNKINNNGGGAAKSSKKKDSLSPAARGVVLSEDDLTESFVRGSGAGGQKINKTSNRVVLVHEPTQLRVECQDTRSLSQNRKIARKRLVEKLDEYYNGRQSKLSMKQQKASQKRNKKKAKNRARLRKKQQENEKEQKQS